MIGAIIGAAAAIVLAIGGVIFNQGRLFQKVDHIVELFRSEVAARHAMDKKVDTHSEQIAALEVHAGMRRGRRLADENP